MGANQSSAEARSVSMDNPTPSGVIDVSDEVVQRLKLGISKAKQQEAKKPETTRAVPVTEPKRAPPAAAAAAPIIQKSTVAPVPPKTTYSNPNPPSSSAVTGGAAAAAAAAMPPYPRLNTEPTITSMELRRQKEIELRENDQLWRDRMAQLETTLNKTNEVMEKEYTKAIEDVRKRFANTAGIPQLPPCQDIKAQVIACYRAHPGETLKCAEEVAMFRNCVETHRNQRLDSQQQKPAAKGA